MFKWPLLRQHTGGKGLREFETTTATQNAVDNNYNFEKFLDAAM